MTESKKVLFLLIFLFFIGCKSVPVATVGTAGTFNAADSSYQTGDKSVSIPTVDTNKTENVDACAVIAKELLEKVSSVENKKPIVATFELTNIANRPCALGKYYTERLITSLTREGKISLVERTAIDKILQEQKFSLSGLSESSSATTVGKLLNADYLIFGWVDSTPANQGQSPIAEITTRMVEVKTGLVIGASTAAEPNRLFIK